MNKSSLFGFAFVGWVLYLGVFQGAKTPGIFMDSHAIILVIGGTIAAALVAYPYASLARTVDYLFWGLLFKKKKEYLKISQEIGAVRECFLYNRTYQASEDSHPFFRESVMFLLNKNIDNEALEEVLSNRSDNFRKRYKEDAKVLMALGKYPPAFGLLGASTGMIEMMQNLGTGGSAGIGKSMAVALVATFWGIAIANFVILPLADSASKASDEDHMLRSMIIDGMMLIRSKATDDHFQAYLRGYLSLADRTELRIYSTKNVYQFTPQTAKEPAKDTQKPSVVEEMKAVAGSDVAAAPRTPGYVEEIVRVDPATAQKPDPKEYGFKDKKSLMGKKK